MKKSRLLDSPTILRCNHLRINKNKDNLIAVNDYIDFIDSSDIEIKRISQIFLRSTPSDSYEDLEFLLN